MDYGEIPNTKEERWEAWKSIRDNHDDLSKDALRGLLADCMDQWGIRESVREKYLQDLLKDIPN